MMNITSNNSRRTIEAQRANLNVMGNNNMILIRDSEVVATVNGNNNTFKIENSRITITFNGNINRIESNASAVNYGFNGNNNLVNNDTNSEYRMQFCNGIGNQHPNQIGQPRQQPNRFARRQRNNPFQAQYQQQNHQNQPQQPNNFEYSYPQYQNQYYQMPQNQNYYYQQSIPNGGGFNQWGNMAVFGNGGFFDSMGQTMNALFGGRSGRNYSFRPRNRQYQFQMYPNPHEIQINQEQQYRGLAKEQINMLPRSKHSGKGSQCTICLCQLQQGEQQTFLMCFHSFHWECIQEWMKKTARCPVCQFDVKAHLRGEQQQ